MLEEEEGADTAITTFRRSRSPTKSEVGSDEGKQEGEDGAGSAYRFFEGDDSQIGRDGFNVHDKDTKMYDLDAVAAGLEAKLGSPMSAVDEDDEDNDIKDLPLSSKSEANINNDKGVTAEKAESPEAEARFYDAAADDE